MSDTISFLDPESLADARTFLARSARVDDTAVRVVASGGVLALYTAAFWPRGLLDRGFTVLGLRTMHIEPGTDVDRVVPLRGVLDRLAVPAMAVGSTVDLLLPDQDVATVWAGISPPRGGWRADGVVAADALRACARDGAAEVGEAIPASAGDHVVQSVRQGVWTRPLPERPDVPAGAAFAADAFGFLGASPEPEDVPVFLNGPWVRLSPSRGHVLARTVSR